MSDNLDFDPNSVGGLGDSLSPAEATDSDEIRNDDGDTVVDPPDHWSEADKIGDDETLDDKLAAEEPDVLRPAETAEGAPDDVAREPGRHRGQIDGTPEDGESLFNVVE